MVKVFALACLLGLGLAARTRRTSEGKGSTDGEGVLVPPYDAADESEATEMPPYDAADESEVFPSFSDLVVDNETVLSAKPTSAEVQVFRELKALRQKGFTCPKGKRFPPNSGSFRFDCRQFRAARGWSVKMARQNFVAHRKDGSTPTTRCKAEGFPSGCAENLAAGNPGASQAMQQWKRSDVHCVIMMNPNYNLMGVGYGHASSSTYKHYWTQKLGKAGSRDRSCM